MRGKAEQDCFAKVHEYLLHKKDFITLSQKDYENLVSYFNNAKPNPEPNNFPDFVFSEGFIEHFRVSAACENKDGSKHTKRIKEFERNFDNNFNRMCINRNGSEAVYSDAIQHKGLSKENFEYSFKRNWSKHLESLEKSNLKNQVGIFMVQYCDSFLQMHGQCKSSGIFVDSDTKYRLSKHGELLEYILQFEKIIQFVIVVTLDSIEFISMSDIQMLLTKLETWDYVICPGFAVEFRSAREYDWK